MWVPLPQAPADVGVLAEVLSRDWEEFAERASSVSVLMMPLLGIPRLRSGIAVRSSSSSGSHSVLSPEMKLVLQAAQQHRLGTQVWTWPPDIQWVLQPWEKCSWKIQHGANLATHKPLTPHSLLRTRRIIYKYKNIILGRVHNLLRPPSWGMRDKGLYAFIFHN